MRSLLSRTIQADTTFSVGLGLIVILAVAEIFAATFYYVGRARSHQRRSPRLLPHHWLIDWCEKASSCANAAI